MTQPAPAIIYEPLKTDVRRLLQYGKEKARTGDSLARLLGYKGDREVRMAIRELIADGLPVASSVTPPYYGFYIANTIDEANDYLRVMRKRLVKDAYRRRDFKLAARNILQPGQLGLF